jgi:hypothetical protein
LTATARQETTRLNGRLDPPGRAPPRLRFDGRFSVVDSVVPQASIAPAISLARRTSTRYAALDPGIVLDLLLLPREEQIGGHQACRRVLRQRER